MEIIKKFEPLFGEWYVEDIIGAGSFGRVYKIYREELGNRFYSALKYISLPADSNEMKQLRADGMDEQSISAYYFTMARDISSETTLMNKLRGNTNIVSFEDSKVVPKPNGIGYDIFIRMELLDSLTNRMVEKTLSINEVAKLGIDICTALMLCAKYGIIHRDIKPDNIFISPNGDYKLGDFGIARQLEKTATFMSKKGTYNYMAPEVYKGEKYGATCDLYSLGLVMYRLLNKGRLPFLPEAPNPITANDREEALKRRFTGEKLPAPCNADEELSAIVLKACAYDPKDRFASAEAMRTALLHYGSGEYSDMSGAIMVNDSTEGTEDGPTESVFTDDSSVDAEEDGETQGVFSGIPLTNDKEANEESVKAFELNRITEMAQRIVSTPISETPKKTNAEPASSFFEKKEKKKKQFTAAALVLMIGLLSILGLFVKGNFAKEANVATACGAKEYEIALITDKGNIDDKSFNQGAWEGVVAYAEANSISHKYYKPEDATDEAYLAAIDLAVESGAKVVVCPGFLFEPAVYDAQTKYPEVKFIILDGAPRTADYSDAKTAENTASIKYAEEQSGYLVGYAAVKDGYRALGFMGGMAVPAVQAFGYGYLQGIEAAAAELGLAAGDITVKYHYTGDFAESDTNKATAAAMYESGIEVIFACGGSVGYSVMSAAAEAGKKVIGVDVDQRYDSETVITSATKGLAASVQSVLKSIYETNDFATTYAGKTTYFNAANNGVGLPTTVIGDENGNAFDRFNTFTVEAYNEIFAKLADGSVSPIRTIEMANAEGYATAEELTNGLGLTIVAVECVQ